MINSSLAVLDFLIALFCLLLLLLQSKPSLKIRTANAIFWISLGMFRDYGPKNISFGNKTFLFLKIESWNIVSWIFSICLKENFMKPHNIWTHSAHSDNFHFHFFKQLSDWVEILWGFTKFFFKQMLKVSAFYLKKQKCFIPIINIFQAVVTIKAKKLAYWPNLNWRFLIQFAANCLLETGGFQ